MNVHVTSRWQNNVLNHVTSDKENLPHPPQTYINNKAYTTNDQFNPTNNQDK